MAAWKLAPALAGGNCVVLKPAEQTPLGISVLMEEIGDLLPPGVLNVVQGFGAEAGEALARSKRIEKIAFTGSTPVGRHILACAAENIIPSTVELGGKSPNIYFEDIMQAEPEFIDKAVEGLVLGFFNQGGLHLPFTRVDPGIHLPAVYGESAGTHRHHPPGRSLRHRDHDRCPGVKTAAVRQDPVVHRHR